MQFYKSTNFAGGQRGQRRQRAEGNKVDGWWVANGGWLAVW